MWLLIVAVSCGGGGGRRQSDANHGSVRVEPSSIYFGVVPWGTTATAEIALWNDSAEDAKVVALDATGDGLVLPDPNPFTVPAGEAIRTRVEWTPESAEGLDSRLDVMGAEGQYTSLSITGGVSYGTSSVSIDGDDFGAVGVGCGGDLDLVIANTGTGELIVSSIDATSPSEFLFRTSGLPVVLPLVLPPRTSESIDVVFAPTVVADVDATITIASNDPSMPVRQLAVHGESFATEERTIEWTAGRLTASTILFDVNEAVYRGAHMQERFGELLVAFFDGLLAAKTPFRVALLADRDGHVEGDTNYIDESFTTAEAVAAAEQMLFVMTEDNDAGLDTCVAAIEENADWVLDEESPWPEAALNLVVMNPDAEQSGGDAAYYVNRYDDYKGGSVVHGIAGDLPDGCTGCNGDAVNFAPPSELLYETTALTGGVYLSICEADWSVSGAALAAACMEALPRFGFPESPSPESIEVFVDGAQVDTGWYYDATRNELSFYESSRPPEGAVVRVDYVPSESCE